MTLLCAIRMLFAEKFTFCRRHEWRPTSIDRSMLWPQVTIGWWTWDMLGPVVGERLAEQLDIVRQRP